VNWCSQGISITNFMQGSRNATVVGNIIRNCCTRVDPNDPGNKRGYGISVEADAVVSGNTVDCAQRAGIIAGTASYTRNLVVADNVIRSTPIGIIASEQASAGTASADQAGYTLISNNMIQTTSSNVNDGIVTATFDDSDKITIVSRKDKITATAYPRILVPATNVLHTMTTPSMGTDACKTAAPFG
jgi:putative cofactor-binding repeat protein